MVKSFTELLDTTERNLKELKWNTRGGYDAIIYNVRFNFVFFGFCSWLLMEGVAQMKTDFKLIDSEKLEFFDDIKMATEYLKNRTIPTEYNYVYISLVAYQQFTQKAWSVFMNEYKPDRVKNIYVLNRDAVYEIKKDGSLELIGSKEKTTPEPQGKLGRIENKELKQRKKDFKNFLNKKYERGQKWRY